MAVKMERDSTAVQSVITSVVQICTQDIIHLYTIQIQLLYTVHASQHC